MDKYGIDNVRGGSFVSINLDKTTIEHLTQMSNGTNDKCFICSKKGHFAKECQVNKEEFLCKYCGKKNMQEQKCKNHEKKCDKNNEKCNCPTSYFSPHRKIKCFLKEL
jgi:hypothetical protein